METLRVGIVSVIFTLEVPLSKNALNDISRVTSMCICYEKLSDRSSDFKHYGAQVSVFTDH